MEIQDMKDLDAILVPISGGGMTAGIAIAAKGINPNIKGIKYISHSKGIILLYRVGWLNSGPNYSIFQWLPSSLWARICLPVWGRVSVYGRILLSFSLRSLRASWPNRLANSPSQYFAIWSRKIPSPLLTKKWFGEWKLSPREWNW